MERIIPECSTLIQTMMDILERGVGGDKKGFPETRGLENNKKQKMNERMYKDLARSPSTESSKDTFVYHIEGLEFCVP